MARSNGTDEYMKFAHRTIRAAGRRVALGDVGMLAELQQLHDHVNAATEHAVTGLLAEGFTLGEIARHLGVSRQAAHKRWQHLQADAECAMGGAA